MRAFRIVVPLFLICGLFCPVLAFAGAIDDIKAGNQAAMSGELLRAEQYYNEAIRSGELSPRNLAVAYSNRGAAKDDQGRTDEAIEDFSLAVKADPGYAPAYYNRSFIYERKGQIAQALKDMEKTVELEPEDKDYGQRLFYLRSKKGSK